VAPESFDAKTLAYVIRLAKAEPGKTRGKLRRGKPME
jgi:hypothetical protein